MTWRDALVTRSGKGGEPVLRAVPANVVTIFANDEAWSGVFAFDAFIDSTVTLAPPPWDRDDKPENHIRGEWAEEDTTRAANWLSRRYGIDLKPGPVEQSIAVVAHRRFIHPVRDWLAKLAHDGTPRIDSLFVDYFGAEDSAYSRGVACRFLIGAVARVYKPGAKVDCTPVLEGDQGIGKSTGVRVLAGDEWFFDSPIVMGDKDGYQALRGKWIGELGELHSLSKSDLNRTKAFLTATADHYRPSFGRRARTFQRQCVFIGTTNAREYLRDETGNRRFWPITCTRVDVSALMRDREQLWAEARVRFEAGEAWHVNTPEFSKLCEAEQEARFVEDAWESVIREWVMHPANPERRRDGVTTGDVLRDALKMPADRWEKREQDRAAGVLRRIGWERGKQLRDGEGKQVRRWKPRAVTLVTMAGDISRTENSGAIHPLSPVSPAPVHTHKQSPDRSVLTTGRSAGFAGDAVTEPELFADWTKANGIGGVQ